MTAKLSADGLTLFRGERLLFKDLSFALSPGELLLLEGQNGSGKTSLMRAIAGLIASSPLLSWLYVIFDQRAAANMIGIVEITAAILIAVRPWSAGAGAIGAMIAAATTAVTLTFLFTAPGWEATLGGFPALSVVPGQFLIKDAVLFGASLWILGDALRELGEAR